MAEKCKDKRPTPTEEAFAQLVADPMDRRSIGEKGMAAGWRDQATGYRAMKRPHVIERVEVLVNEAMRGIRARRSQVLTALADRATSDRTDANEASRIFFQATGDIGTGGVSVNTNVKQVNQNDDDDFDPEEFLRERAEIAAKNTGGSS